MTDVGAFERRSNPSRWPSAPPARISRIVDRRWQAIRPLLSRAAAELLDRSG